MKRSQIALLVVILAAVAGAASFAMPIPAANTTSDLSFHAYLAATAMLAVLYVGASVVFLLSLTGFTKSLKQTYAIICVGFALLGLAFIQLPLAVYGGTVERLFKAGSLTAVFFLVAFFAIIFGTRRLAKLFGVRSLVTKWWFIFIPPLVLAGLYSLLPHFPTSTPELRFDATNGFNIFNAWIDAMVLSQLVQIKRAAGVQYTKALAWMIISFSLQLAAVTGYLAAVLPLGDKEWFLIGAVPLIPLLFAGASLVASSSSFSKITGEVAAEPLRVITARSFFGTPVRSSKANSAVTSIDIVIYAASLVSQPREIDNLLDAVRNITARLSTGGQPTAMDDAQLRNVYLAIEEYLLTREQVRTFTKQSLRQTVANGLKLSGTSNTFWNSLPA